MINDQGIDKTVRFCDGIHNFQEIFLFTYVSLKWDDISVLQNIIFSKDSFKTSHYASRDTHMSIGSFL